MTQEKIEVMLEENAEALKIYGDAHPTLLGE